MFDLSRNPAWKITLIYLVVSLLWILLSDQALLTIAPTAEDVSRLQTYKGWFFVLVTSGGLYLLLRASYRRLEREMELLQRHQEALIRSERRYREFVANTAEGIFLYEPQAPVPIELPVEEQVERLYRGRIVDGNDAMARMLGFADGQALAGHTLGDLHGRAETLADRAFLAAWIDSDHQIRGIESCRAREDGSAAWFVSSLVGTVEDGNLVRVWATQSDITERKRANQALRDNEEKYRLLVENQTDLIVKVDAEGRFQFVSPSYCRLFGKSEAELLGRTFLPLVHEEDRAATTAAMQVLQRPPHSCYLEQRAMTARGWRWLAWSDQALVDDSGAITAIVGSGRDISDLKRAELALRDSERRFRAVFNQQFQFMAILAPDGMTLEISELPLRATNARREDFVGHLFWQTPGWAGLPEWQDIWPRRIAAASSVDHAILTQDVYRAADGSVREAAAATSAIRDETGEVEFILVQASDNTEQRVAERERDRLMADLQTLNESLERAVRGRTAELTAANQELQSFAYTVSHDLRAPVRAIHGFEKALREDFGRQLPAGALDYLDEIRTGADRMSGLINGLLELSRSSRGEIERTSVDLGALARDILGQLAREHPQRRVEVEIADALVVDGDPRLLRNLLHNLLENAWKFTAGVDPARIRVDRVDFPGARGCCIEDSGIGFDPAFGHRLFEPFQRLHTQDEVPGVGIGLATAMRIVHRHGGDIAGCGRPGQGARFCFIL